MVRWLSDIGRPDTERVGTKAANLGTLFSGDHAVPRGFCIEHQRIEDQLEQSGIRRRIDRILRTLDRDDWSAVQNAAQRINGIIHDVDFEASFQEEIESAYENINLSQKVRNAGDKAVELVGGQRETDFVAVRPSTLQDGFATPEIGINGKEAVLSAIKDVIASGYNADALYHDAEQTPAIMIQKMVDADLSCTVYTRNPVTGDDEILIEAVYGLGLGIARGDCRVDRFFIDRSTGRLNEKTIATKRQQYTRNPATGTLQQATVSNRKQDDRTCSSDMLSDIVNKALDIASRLDDPLRIDLSVGRNKTFILDAQEPAMAQSQSDPMDASSPLISGITASPGRFQGDVRQATGSTLPSDSDVTVDTNTDQQPLAHVTAVGGVVTDHGVVASRSAQQARSRDVPMIIETENATTTMNPGDTVTLDGATGMVYGAETPTTTDEPHQSTATSVPTSATRLFVLDGEVSRADGRVRQRPNGIQIQTDDETITVTTAEDDGIDGFYVTDYASVLQAHHTNRNSGGHVVFDVDQLVAKDDVLDEAVRTVCEDGRCMLLMREPRPSILETAIDVAVEGIIIPENIFDTVEQQLARKERRYLLDELRHQDDEQD